MWFIPKLGGIYFFRNKSQVNELFGHKKVPNQVRLQIVDIKHYSLAEQIKLPFVFNQSKLDLLHVPHFNAPFFYTKPIVLTIHDLLWHQHRGSQVTTLSPWQYWLKYGFYKAVTKRAIAHASALLVPSRTIAQTVEKYYPKAKPKINVTYEGVAQPLISKAQQKNQNKKDKTKLLYVGSLYPHKNVELILEALKHLPEYSLTVVSSRTVFTQNFIEKVDRAQLKIRVKFLGSISDQRLAQEYQSAGLVVQPSKSEGFGLTGIEALIFKTPVVAANTAIFHEIYQDAAAYFNPNSSADFVKTIRSLEKKAVYRHLQKKATIISSQYSWNNLVDQTWQVYQKLLTH